MFRYLKWYFRRIPLTSYEADFFWRNYFIKIIKLRIQLHRLKSRTKVIKHKYWIRRQHLDKIIAVLTNFRLRSIQLVEQANYWANVQLHNDGREGYVEKMLEQTNSTDAQIKEEPRTGEKEEKYYFNWQNCSNFWKDAFKRLLSLYI